MSNAIQKRHAIANALAVDALALSHCVLPGNDPSRGMCLSKNNQLPAGFQPLLDAGVIRRVNEPNVTCFRPGKNPSDKLCFSGEASRDIKQLAAVGVVRNVNGLQLACDAITLLPNSNRTAVCRVGGTGAGPTQKINCDKLNGETWHDPPKNVLFKCIYSPYHGCIPNLQSTAQMAIAQSCEKKKTVTQTRLTTTSTPPTTTSTPPTTVSPRRRRTR